MVLGAVVINDYLRKKEIRDTPTSGLLGPPRNKRRVLFLGGLLELAHASEEALPSAPNPVLLHATAAASALVIFLSGGRTGEAAQVRMLEGYATF